MRTGMCTVEKHSEWAESLRKVSSQPLSFCPDFQQVAKRWEAWWRFDADRPLLVAPTRKRADIRWDKAFDLLEKPDAWLEVRRQQFENTCWIGDTLPNIRVDIGPVATAAFLGAPLHFALEENTSWQTPIIDEWSDEAVLVLDENNHWLQVVLQLAQRVAQDAAGKYVVALPDLSGAVDILANMRGSQSLLTDLYDNPDAIVRAADKLMDAWERVFVLMYDTVTGADAGVVNWLLAWSDRAYALPTCDFNFMIGPEHFQKICLPSLAEQSRRAGRCLFHLDGEGASRHAEALAEEPLITAIQYSPGAGTPSALAKLDMFRLFQEARKPLVVACPQTEVPELIDKLDHRGLAIFPDVDTPEEAERLVRIVA